MQGMIYSSALALALLAGQPAVAANDELEQLRNEVRALAERLKRAEELLEQAGAGTVEEVEPASAPVAEAPDAVARVNQASFNIGLSALSSAGGSSATDTQL